MSTFDDIFKTFEKDYETVHLAGKKKDKDFHYLSTMLQHIQYDK